MEKIYRDLYKLCDKYKKNLIDISAIDLDSLDEFKQGDISFINQTYRLIINDIKYVINTNKPQEFEYLDKKFRL